MMLKRSAEALSEILGMGTPTDGGDLLSPQKLSVIKYHQTFRVKNSDCLSLPHVIVPADGDVEDFFATLAAYHQDRSPLSALVHVLSSEISELVTKRPGELINQKTTKGKLFLTGCAGAMLGEAALSRLWQSDGAEITYAACRRSLSFSLSRALLLHGGALSPHLVTDRWLRLRKATRLKVSDAAVEAVLLMHSLASGANFSQDSSGLPQLLKEGLRGFIEREDQIDEPLFSALIELYPGIQAHLNGLKGAFDGRLKAFLQIVDVINMQSHGVRSDEIAVAFFCNRILPGSFSHVGLLTKMVGAFPSAVVWYGFLSALSPASNSNRNTSTLIAKLERDLLDPFSFEQRPRCDISLEELEVLSRTSLRPDLLIPIHSQSILVSILPGVDIYTRLVNEDGSAVDRLRREAEADELNARASRLIEEALYTLRKARAATSGDHRMSSRPSGKR